MGNSNSPAGSNSQSNETSESTITHTKMLLTTAFALMIIVIIGTFISSVLLFDSGNQSGELSGTYKSAAVVLGSWNLAMCIALLIVGSVAYMHRAKIEGTVSKTLTNLHQGGPSVIIPHPVVHTAESPAQHQEPSTGQPLTVYKQQPPQSQMTMTTAASSEMESMFV